jgi:hypothetical protein
MAEGPGGILMRPGAVGNRWRQRRRGVVYQLFRIDGDTLVLDVGDETTNRVGVVGHNLNAAVRQGHPAHTHHPDVIQEQSNKMGNKQ